MSRSKWKGNFYCREVLNTIHKIKKYSNNQAKLGHTRVSKQFFKITSRSSVIPAALLGSVGLVYDGKQFRKVYITEDKIGYKFGEFSYTRKRNTAKKLNRQKQK